MELKACPGDGCSFASSLFCLGVQLAVYHLKESFLVVLQYLGYDYVQFPDPGVLYMSTGMDSLRRVQSLALFYVYILSQNSKVSVLGVYLI